MSKNFFQIPDDLISPAFPEKSALPEYRSVFMRDRDRIMYATAFRRLAGKTQIYTIGADDHKKNRLTHSLEVSQIARTIAKALNLNEPLAEAISLAHDFGHTPFGHAGEEMLHSIMIPNSKEIKDSPFYKKTKKEIEDQIERESLSEIEDSVDIESIFGFKHNIQSVRVAAVLEDSYRNEDSINIGLNLTNYTLWGMLNHSSIKYSVNVIQPNYQSRFQKIININGLNKEAWSFEGYIVKIADDIAQWHHDLEDAIRGNAIPIDKICDTITEAIGNALSEEDKALLTELSSANSMTRKALAQLSHIVVNTLVNDLVKKSKDNLNCLQKEINSYKSKTKEKDKSHILYSKYDDLFKKGKITKPRESIISFSDKIRPEIFKNSIIRSVHHSRNVERMNEKGKYIIKKLFQAYSSHPQQMPDGPILHFMVEIKQYKSLDEGFNKGMGVVRTDFEKQLKNMKYPYKIILMRRICDHIASMTDRYAIEEYGNLYG